MKNAENFSTKALAINFVLFALWWSALANDRLKLLRFDLFESEAGKQPEGLRSSVSSKNWSVAKLLYENAHVFSYTF